MFSSNLQKAIENGNGEVQRLLQEVEAHVHLNQPINENAAHPARDLVTAQESTGVHASTGDIFRNATRFVGEF